MTPCLSSCSWWPCFLDALAQEEDAAFKEVEGGCEDLVILQAALAFSTSWQMTNWVTEPTAVGLLVAEAELGDHLRQGHLRCDLP